MFLLYENLNKYIYQQTIIMSILAQYTCRSRSFFLIVYFHNYVTFFKSEKIMNGWCIQWNEVSIHSHFAVPKINKNADSLCAEIRISEEIENETKAFSKMQSAPFQKLLVPFSKRYSRSVITCLKVCTTPPLKCYLGYFQHRFISFMYIFLI